MRQAALKMAAVAVAGTALAVAAVPRFTTTELVAQRRLRLAAHTTEPLTAAQSTVTIRPLATSNDIRDALITDPTCRSLVTGVSVQAAAPNTQVLVVPSYGRSSFTNPGNVLVLGSGDPTHPTANCCIAGGPPLGTDWGAAGCGGDLARVDITFDVTDPTVKTMSMQFDVYTYEFPTFTGAGYGDAVFAYWDQAPTFDQDTCAPTPLAQFCPSGNGCAGAVSAQGGLLTFDQQTPCQPTDANNAFFTPCSVIGCDSGPDTPGWETVYNPGGTPGELAGRTGVLSTSWPVTPGFHTLTLLVADVGDGSVDTVGVFHGLVCSTSTTGCAATAPQPDSGGGIPALGTAGLATSAALLAALGFLLARLRRS